MLGNIIATVKRRIDVIQIDVTANNPQKYSPVCRSQFCTLIPFKSKIDNGKQEASRFCCNTMAFLCKSKEDFELSSGMLKAKTIPIIAAVRRRVHTAVSIKRPTHPGLANYNVLILPLPSIQYNATKRIAFISGPLSDGIGEAQTAPLNTPTSICDGGVAIALVAAMNVQLSN